MPDYFLTRRYPTGPEEYFTVAWWEQRGSGMSYRSSIPAASRQVVYRHEKFDFHPYEAHSPLFEEPVRLREIMVRDVLAGGNRLADRA